MFLPRLGIQVLRATLFFNPLMPIARFNENVSPLMVLSFFFACKIIAKKSHIKSPFWSFLGWGGVSVKEMHYFCNRYHKYATIAIAITNMPLLQLLS